MSLITVQDANGKSLTINSAAIETAAEAASQKDATEVVMLSGKKHIVNMPIKAFMTKVKRG